MRAALIASLTLIAVAALDVPARTDGSGGVTPSAVYRNGSGVNPRILARRRPPVIGGFITLTLDCSNYPPVVGTTNSMAVIRLHESGHPGLPTRVGEVLVDLRSRAIHSFSTFQFGTINTFNLQIPNDPRLCGLNATVQGMCVGSFSAQLSNAFDMVIGG